VKEILVDLYKVKDIYSGLGQFSINYANELIRQSPEGFDFTFLTPGNFKFETGINVTTVKTNLQKRYFPVFNRSYDIWHGLQQFPSFFPKCKSRFILTVHDLNFLQEKKEVKKLKYLKKLQKNIDRADYITTISDFTKKTIEDHIDLRGKSIRTIYNGITINTHDTGSKPSYAGNKKFFFSIGIFNEKKNFHVLLSVMKHFKDHQLIIAGNKDTRYGQQVQKQIHEMNLADRVILPGRITDNAKTWLYSHCDAFLFPSLAEGFGMPVIEAMKFGKPVFLSQYTSLPEIGGDAAFYFDNFNEEYMSSFIKIKLSLYNENQKILSDQIKKYADRFSWETCIGQYLKLYQDITDKS
jgi:glycosyltransferase involved in cell wall biosynthesis